VCSVSAVCTQSEKQLNKYRSEKSSINKIN
jgi:hypothetical protein